MIKIFVLILPVLIIIVNNLFKKKKLLPSLSSESHQKFVEKKNVPLTGGLFIFLSLSLVFYQDLKIFVFFLFIIFLLGILSDLKILSSPSIRLCAQILLILSTVFFCEIQISSTRVMLLDFVIKHEIVNIFFVLLCILIIVNGTNFVDGLNGLVIGYFIIVLLVILKYDLYLNINIEQNSIIYLIGCFFIILIFNLYNQLYIGDNGAYIIGLFFSYVLISIYENSNNISPFFILVLFWYPGYEILFSIVRKFRFRRSPILPDVRHLHQLIFYFIKKKLKYSNLKTNNLSSVLINIYNFIVIYLSAHYMGNSQIQIMILTFSILFYSFIYTKLFGFRYSKLIFNEKLD